MTPAPRSVTSEPARFEALFEAELPYVWTSLRRLGVHARDLEDVAHEVFLAVYRRIAELDASRSPRPWLFAFALRHAADYRRLARHRAELLGDDDPPRPPDSSPTVEEALSRRERAAFVERALEALDMDRRAVVILHDLDEVPMPEVARTLGIPLNTGYSRLRTGREELAAVLRREAKVLGGTP